MLTSRHNPTIKQIRKLQELNGRREQKCFLVEGTHLVEEAVAMEWPLRAVCFTSRWADKHAMLFEKVFSSVEKILVSDQVLTSLATTENPDGVLAVAVDQISPMITTRDISLAIAIDRLQNPDNLGSLIRTSTALGADGVVVGTESVDRTSPKVLRASAGQWFRQPPHKVDLSDWIGECRSAAIQVIGAAAQGECFWDIDFIRPTVFVLGNEGSGISPGILDQVDKIISIPMARDVESLNVAVAGALLLGEAMRQRHQCKMSSDCTDE